MMDTQLMSPAGPTFFFTVNLEDPGSRLLTDRIDLLRFAFAKTHQERPFRVGAMVVLPDHIHALWTLPEHDADAQARWKQIKGWFADGLDEATLCGGARIWQARIWQRRVRDAADYRRHRDYCWSDPVRHGLAARPADWEFSSFHRDVSDGLVEESWTHPGAPIFVPDSHPATTALSA